MPRPNDPHHHDSNDVSLSSGVHHEALPLDAFEPELHRIDQLVRESVQVDVPAGLADRIVQASTPDLPAPRTLPMVATESSRPTFARSLWGSLAVAASLALVATVGWWAAHQPTISGPGSGDTYAEATPRPNDTTEHASTVRFVSSFDAAISGGSDETADPTGLSDLIGTASVCPPCLESELVHNFDIASH